MDLRVRGEKFSVVEPLKTHRFGMFIHVNSYILILQMIISLESVFLNCVKC